MNQRPLNNDELQKMMQLPDENPVVMINLLKFKTETANGNSGKEVYQQYMKQAAPLLAKVGGRLLWKGTVENYIVAGDSDHWDQVLLVEYPSRAAFLKLVNMPEFQAIQVLRSEALEDTVLISSNTGGE